MEPGFPVFLKARAWKRNPTQVDVAIMEKRLGISTFGQLMILLLLD